MRSRIAELERAINEKRYIDLSTVMKIEDISKLTGICEDVIKNACEKKAYKGMYIKIATLISEKHGAAE